MNKIFIFSTFAIFFLVILSLYVKLGIKNNKRRRGKRFLDGDDGGTINFDITSVDYTNGICVSDFGPDYAFELIANFTGKDLESVQKVTLNLTIGTKKLPFTCTLPIVKLTQDEPNGRVVRIPCIYEGENKDIGFLSDWEITAVESLSYKPPLFTDSIEVSSTSIADTYPTTTKPHARLYPGAAQDNGQILNLMQGEPQYFYLKFSDDLDNSNMPTVIYIGTSIASNCEVIDTDFLRCPVYKGQVRGSPSGIAYHISVQNQCFVNEDADFNVTVISESISEGFKNKLSFMIIVIICFIL